MIATNVVFLSAVLAHILLQDLDQAGLGIVLQLLVLLGGCAARWSVHENACLHLDLQTASSRLEATSAILAGCCDAVVWTDDRLVITQDSPQLVALLDKKGALRSLAEVDLLSLFRPQDRLRVQQHFHSLKASHALALHSCLLDSNADAVNVELLHIGIQENGTRHFLIGIREFDVESHTTASAPTRRSCTQLHSTLSSSSNGKQCAELDACSGSMEEAGRHGQNFVKNSSLVGK